MKDLNLILADVETLEILNTYSCMDVVNQVEWAPDSQHVLTAMHKRGIVQVWSLQDSEWRCRIDEGVAGIANARWSPDSRHILSVADFQVRVAVRSLVNRTVVYLDSPKFASKGFAFNNDGRWLAMLGRHECHDNISIIACDTWEAVKQFQIESSDCADISWSPDERYIAAWDNALEYRQLVYLPNGSLLSKYSAYEHQLGIKTVSWSPSSQFIAAGSYDNRVRLFNNISWKVIGEYNHAVPVTSESAIVYYETLDNSNQSTYTIGSPPHTFPCERLDPADANPKLGVGQSLWSPDSRHLATQCDAMPSVLWIWETLRLSIMSLIVQKSPILSFMWDPTQPRLALCTGNSKVYFWSANGCSCVDVPAQDFVVRKVQWSPHGDYLILQDRRDFCVCYMASVEF